MGKSAARLISTRHTLRTAIPLPQGISPPVTEVGLSRPTALLIGLENPVGLSGRPRRRPSECRAGNQRDQCESSDEHLHGPLPLVTELADLRDIRLPADFACAELLQNSRSCIDRRTPVSSPNGQFL